MTHQKKGEPKKNVKKKTESMVQHNQRNNLNKYVAKPHMFHAKIFKSTLMKIVKNLLPI